MSVLAADVISLLILIIGLLAIMNFSLYFWIRKNELDIEELRSYYFSDYKRVVLEIGLKELNKQLHEKEKAIGDEKFISK